MLGAYFAIDLSQWLTLNLSCNQPEHQESKFEHGHYIANYNLYAFQFQYIEILILIYLFAINSAINFHLFCYFSWKSLWIRICKQESVTAGKLSLVTQESCQIIKMYCLEHFVFPYMSVKYPGLRTRRHTSKQRNTIQVVSVVTSVWKKEPKMSPQNPGRRTLFTPRA